jgi:GNAT superfamily N-acetyltransferase
MHLTDALNRGLCLKRDIGAKSNICKKLRFEAAKGVKRLQFLLLEYRFFMDSDEGSALPLGLPWFLWPLSLTLHIIKSHALALLRLPCYFVKLETKTVGLWAIQEHRESLFVASLGVAEEYRRLGIGTCILGYIEGIAKRMGKRWLEVDVLTKNIPAQRLYAKCGFAFTQSEKMLCTMGKKVCIDP